MADSYHHGDLRQALLDVGAEALDEGGLGALTLRGLARRAGVSASAPYNHFDGKTGLVTALAEHALETLDAALAAAIDAETDPVRRFHALGVAYVAFALDHPERFRLAFRPELVGVLDEMTNAASAPPEDQTAFRQLVRVARELEPDPVRQIELIVTAWGLVHGIAALLVDGPLGGMMGDRDHTLALVDRLIDRLRI